MNDTTLLTMIGRHAEHMAFCTYMDEELGTLHGLSWTDFTLLVALHRAGGALATPEVAGALGLARSRIILQLLPLEKIGLVERIAGDDGKRRVALRPAGRALMHEASGTAAALCGARMGKHPSASPRP